MKVLYLLDESWDSGLTASALTTASLLKKNGLYCKILCRNNSYAERVAKELSIEHFSFSASWLFSLNRIARWVKEEGFEILHAHTGSTHTLAWVLKRRLPHLHVFRTRADDRRVRKNWFYSMVLAKTDAVIFPSKRLREDFLLAYDYPLHQTHVIYPTIEEAPSARAQGPSSSVKITLVARLDPVKGQEDFIAAAALIAAQFPEATFEIIGEEKNTKISQLYILTRRLRAARNVKILGFLSLQELRSAMAQTTLAVVASRGSEVVSRVTLEWMRLGKPLVATRVGVIAELLQDGKAGVLVDPCSPEEMAYAIKKLLLDSGLRASLGQAAQEAFGRCFAPEVNLKSHLALYENILRNFSL